MSINSIMQQKEPHVQFTQQPFFRPILVTVADPGKFNLARSGVEPRGYPQLLARSEFEQWRIRSHGRRAVRTNQGDNHVSHRRKGTISLAASTSPAPALHQPCTRSATLPPLVACAIPGEKPLGLIGKIWAGTVHAEGCRGPS